MDKKIKWTSKALRNYLKIIDHIVKEWSFNSALKFEKILQLKLQLLSQFPESGNSSGLKKGYHKLIITRQNSIFYSIKQNEILILNIHDNRQDPDRKKY
ncbi:MAG: type II toxin-antitoxin system RelE/ParE family toxin [Ignavibacteria bacterium]